MAVNTNTVLYREGTTPNTRAVVSSKNRIFAPASGNSSFLQIGVLASFSPNESRTVEQIRGIGFGDQIAELVPGVTEAMTISVTRTALYLANVFQVFGYNSGVDGLVRSLKHHRFPFDIKHELVFSSLSENEGQQGTRDVQTQKGNTLPALITIFEGCWMTNWSWEYTSDAAMVQENCEILVTDVVDGISEYHEFIDTGLTGEGGTYLSNILST